MAIADTVVHPCLSSFPRAALAPSPGFPPPTFGRCLFLVVLLRWGFDAGIFLDSGDEKNGNLDHDNKITM